LKKQSQFVPGLIGATSYLKGNYENSTAGVAIKNKPNFTRSAFFVLRAAIWNFANGLRDCCGPSGLAMTFVSCSFVLFWWL
jgi:hypothetical protein